METFQLLNPEFVERVVGKRGRRGVDAYLGVVVDSLVPGRIEAHFDVTDELVTMMGSIHGGCLSVLCDHCLGVILYPVMPPGYWAATTEFKVNLLRPVTKGTCRATGEILTMSKRLAVVRIDVTNDDRLVAVAQGTCTIVAPKGEG
jgi:1,4-dihydroxy-2-naphthoyl-CoA hydrolase